jgi:uncharacterized protein (DUF697 family)/ethanolamine utilization protein EutP (predicted NTPase)
MTPSVYILGKHNAGKTALIRACADNAVCIPYQNLDGVELYQTPCVNFIKRQETDLSWIPLEQEAQAIWFCIDGTVSDLSQESIDFIHALGRRVLLVVTKCDLLNEEQIKALNDSLLKHVLREQIVLISEREKSGFPQLIRKTKCAILNTAKKLGYGFLSLDFETSWDNFFSSRLKIWSQKNEEEANSYITWAAGRAAAIAIVPLPLADVTPLVANEVYMIYKLAGVYGIANDQSLISMILGCTGGSLVGKIGASFLPFLKIPIAAAVTYGVGKAAKAFFESGMELDEETLLDIFEKAKEEASNLFW